MPDHVFGITIAGPGVSPETIRLRDLYDILQAFEAAVSDTSRHQGRGAGGTEFHLVGIRRGSAECAIAIDEPGYAAAAFCATAIASGDLSVLPERARDGLFSIKAKVRPRDWIFRISSGNGMPTAEIKGDTHFVTDAVVSGASSLTGRLLRVGGIPRPTAQLALPDGRKLTVAIASEELAVRMGTLLYRVISVEGEAKWSSADWSLLDFKVTNVGNYDQDANITGTLAALAEIAGDYWSDIDPDEYIMILRGEPDEWPSA
ncbi:MAG TPA: hypothetical protein VND64_15780 [Pirellulales bacterium]|nr:hypothetical protein [Pirellulales bacterium]